MNIKLYTYYGAPDIWLEYSEWQGDLCVDGIYIGSDPQRVDILDFVSQSVLDHAEERMRQDYQESRIDAAEYQLDDR